MRVKCVICDTVNDLDDNSPLAKKLRNRPIHTYMCEPCRDRITIKTEQRLATGNFRLFRTSSPIDEDF
ncbi:YlaI family protein [Lysinibacillus endophyticus]|uniref:YlaI family protein n=1 Tax=Ureibacillus endophyticus TaxID=1978490 RepID=UPI003136EB6A